LSATPLVAIVTPTWQRDDLLFTRCIPSVAAQSYPHIEHIVVHDGPVSDEFRERFLTCHEPGFRRLIALPEHPAGPHWGTHCRLAAIASLGDDGAQYIGYVDDDDALRPRHTELLMDALAAHPDAGFAYSRMVQHNPSGEHVIGDCVPPVYGQIGSPMVLHRRSILATAASWGEPDAAEDWKMIELWLAAGVGFTHVPQDTVDVWPSAYAGL
jgi:glycosyltransferase involved in cell wall biosynthesis